MRGKFYESYKEFVEQIQDKKLVLFGAGSRSLDIFYQYYYNSFNDISFICDNDKSKWGGAFFNIPICSPQVLLKAPKDYVVLITVRNRFSVKRIMQQLNEMGMPYVYPSEILDFTLNNFWRYDSHGNKKYHELHTYKVISDNIDKIRQVRALLCDEKSVQLYDAYIERVKYNVKYYNDITDNIYESYFSDNIFKYSNEEILVDGGALNGDDTIWIASFLKQNSKKLKKAYIFEPETTGFCETYRNLESYFCEKANLSSDGNMANINEFQVLKAGLYDKNSKVNFCLYDNEGSCFIENETSGSDVPVIKLDDVIKDEKVTFIKYDLEGAEIPAIRGAENTIKKNKPKLALSIYHNIEDLWEIPLLIKEYVPEYRLFIRHHTGSVYDKTLYAALDQDLEK